MRLRHMIKYASVSVVSTITGLAILGVLVGAFGIGAGWSNVVATAIGTVPSFELNRRWVWAERSKRPTARQVIPFCSLSFLGLLLSTIAVRIAAANTAKSGSLLHTGAVEVANIGTYGLLWVVQFALCERLFRNSQSHGGEEVVGMGNASSARS
jgi:putative flippase GtrA